jgi:glyoxylase-like metal-dependent hydrolase (beta-lactamase superfamily II)
MGYTIRVIPFARQAVPGPQAYWLSHWGEWVEFNYYAFLIRGEGHVALVDCGIDDLIAFNAMNLGSLGERGLVHLSDRERSIVDYLADEGLRPGDIDTVAFTHFHADHISNARLFPDARFLVSAEGWRRFQVVRRDTPGLVPEPVFPHAVLDFLESVREERLVLTEDGQTSLPGIAIKHVGGHTEDSAAFVVPTAEGRVVIPGDTVWQYGNLEADHPVGSATSIPACYAAMAWVRTAGEIVLPTHDPLVLTRHHNGIVG